MLSHFDLSPLTGHMTLRCLIPSHKMQEQPRMTKWIPDYILCTHTHTLMLTCKLSMCGDVHKCTEHAKISLGLCTVVFLHYAFFLVYVWTKVNHTHIYRCICTPTHAFLLVQQNYTAYNMWKVL